MKILIAEDDFASRKFIMRFMSIYGKCDAVVDGLEAIEAFSIGLDSNEPYDLVCLDVMMPKVDGIMALKIMRELEEVRKIETLKKVKIIIATALGETQYVMSGMNTSNEIYVSKPIDIEKMKEALNKLALI